MNSFVPPRSSIISTVDQGLRARPAMTKCVVALLAVGGSGNLVASGPEQGCSFILASLKPLCLTG